MGQYHIPANLDKREFIHPHNFGDGLKMMEFGCSADGTMTGLTVLLASSHNRGGGDLHVSPEQDTDGILGRWAGDRIAIIGDYSEDDDFPGLEAADTPFSNRDGWTDISLEVIRVLNFDAYLNIEPPAWAS